MKIFTGLFMASLCLVMMLSGCRDKIELPSATTVLKGEIGETEELALKRMFAAPYTSLPWVRADLTNETVSSHDVYDKGYHVWNRPFKFYSGDISGRYLELMSILSNGDRKYHPFLDSLMAELPSLQQEDGHFGWAAINWNDSIDFSQKTPKMMPALWGNGRMLCGLVEAYSAFNDPAVLNAARRLGDFYLSIADRFMDSTRIDEYQSGGTYAAAYMICYFNAIEGLVKLYRVTTDKKYLAMAERMADFYTRFDVLPMRHNHGMLSNQFAMLLLYEDTKKDIYLGRVEERWKEMVDNGYVNAAGGVPEGSLDKAILDEACALTDWLRVNLKLFEIAGQRKYIDMAERLIWNHYAANQHSNGGYGHRYILNDDKGAIGFSKYLAEATWCCVFHGLLGFHYIKPLVATFHNDELQLNLVLEYEAALGVEKKGWKLQSTLNYDEKDNNLIVQTLQLYNAAGQSVHVSIRKPDWAGQMSITTADGRPVEFEEGAVYWRSKKKLASAEKLLVRYTNIIRLEDRNFNPLAMQAKGTTIHDLVIRQGPKLLLLDDAKMVPTIEVNTEKISEGLLTQAFSQEGRDVTLQPGRHRNDSMQAVFVFKAGFK